VGIRASSFKAPGTFSLFFSGNEYRKRAIVVVDGLVTLFDRRSYSCTLLVDDELIKQGVAKASDVRRTT
jgi:hypothetical protein